MQPSIESQPAYSSRAEVAAWVSEVRAGLGQGALAPYLGPGTLPEKGAVPSSYEALAKFFGSKVALPRRARGNLWASAQYIESNKHRQTAEKFMAEAFSQGNEPTAFHRYLATLPASLIVDSWYDGGMRAALAARTDWLEVQGGSKAAVGEARWFRTYTPTGEETGNDAAHGATTVLYKPHGAVAPANNFLLSDADYVEVLTEIDIQTPIPRVVKERRTKLGFVFLGCRFHDQTMRIFARQVVKRSEGPRFMVVDPSAGFTKNEAKFAKELGARVVVMPTGDCLGQLMA